MTDGAARSEAEESDHGALPDDNPIARLFELPAIVHPPGGDREVEELVARGRHAEAAERISSLTFASALDRNRAGEAEALCWMHAGRPERAVHVLRSGKRSMANAWYLTCALVRAGRLPEAAAEVTWLGERVPLIGGQRRAAQSLLGALGRQLPSWLADGRTPSQPSDLADSRPPPYLVSFFDPQRPEVPRSLADVAEAIQRGRYEDAARQLITTPTSEPAASRQLAFAAAACWLLAGQPEPAEALLRHRLPPAATWTLACAHVHQNHLDAALVPLASLARRGALTDERLEAAAVLAAHLGLDVLPDGLEVLAGHPLLDLAAAQAAGYRRFVETTVREIERQRSPDAVAEIVRRVVLDCASIPEDDARHVLVATYEAAVRATSADHLAEPGLNLLIGRPELLARDGAECSRALLFATACDRLDELRDRLRELATDAAGADARYTCWLAAAKLSLVQADLQGIAEHAANAATAATSPEAEARAARLLLAAGWLEPNDTASMSDWQLRRLHHLLPEPVVARLEDLRAAFPETLAERAGVTVDGRRAVDAAAACLRAAAAAARDAAALGRLRLELGRWAQNVAIAMREAAWPDPAEVVAYTAAACALLGPEPSPDVIAVHADALEAAAGCPAEDLAAAQRPVAMLPPPGAPPALGGLVGVSGAELAAVERCFAAREALLPDGAPFRGPRWFRSEDVRRHYLEGWRTANSRDAARAFEDAWLLEPNNRVTIQGLVFGLARRLRDQPRRRHVLERLAHLLDEMADREVEAAVAHRCLAEHAGAGTQEWRARLERAAAALERRIRREPWPRARDAQIAIQLELGNLDAAGEAAWEESRQWLPGSETSGDYARLAAALWTRASDLEHVLDDRVHEARLRAVRPPLTNREAVQQAVEAGRLLSLSRLRLDDDSLEDLWRLCRGDEDDLCRFLEKQGASQDVGQPDYLAFMVRKLERWDPPAAVRIRNWYLAPESAVEPAHMPWLRLAAAELVTHDPLLQVPRPLERLGNLHLREFMASLRDCAAEDRGAYATFSAAVEDALATLFELRQAVSTAEPQPYGARLARAQAAVGVVSRAGTRFGTPALARMAGLLASYLELALDAPAVEAYLRDKEQRLVPSRLGVQLANWWARLTHCGSSLDFFHHHHFYRLPTGAALADWWAQHQVLGVPVRDAVEQLATSLEERALQLHRIEQAYRSSRTRPDVGLRDFGLADGLVQCSSVLRTALRPDAGADDVRAVEGALKRLGESLRRCEVARLGDADGVLTENSLPLGCYLLPRAPELLSHWRRNAGGGPCLLAVFEVRDDSGQEVLCMVCLDGETSPVPETTPLRGLAPFADLVEALGGQLHLWASRSGQAAGCRRTHDDGRPCAADEYVHRIQRRLRQLADERWRSRRSTVQPWLGVLEHALRSQQSAALAFAILPRLHE